MALTQISTAGVKDDAVTSGKIPANAVGSSELADNAVDTNAIVNVAVTSGKIADSAITNSKVSSSAAISGTKLADNSIPLAKLPNGDSNNNGKFLRANNGADPSFETITGTTINNNADNRVITGTGTANTIQGESGLLFDGQEVQITNAQPKLKLIDTGVSNVEARVDGDGGNLIIAADHNNAVADTTMTFTIDQSEKLRIDSSGRVLIGTTTEGQVSADDLTVASSANTGITIRSGTSNDGNLYFSDGTSGDDEYKGYLVYEHNNDRLRFGAGHTERISIDAHGLKFNGDTAAANALDDYEEGTFSLQPVNGWGILNGGALNPANADISEGKYVRIGATVFIYASYKEGSSSGASFNGNRIEFTGMPFSAEGPVSSSNLQSPLPTVGYNLSNNGIGIFMFVSGPAATTAGMYRATSSGRTNWTGSDLGNSGQIWIRGSYRIDGT